MQPSEQPSKDLSDGGPGDAPPRWLSNLLLALGAGLVAFAVVVAWVVSW